MKRDRFPNFARWPNRLSVLRGRMPVTRHLPYQWYDTPNIRVGTFKDFEVLAHKNRLRVLDAFGLQEGTNHPHAAQSARQHVGVLSGAWLALQRALPALSSLNGKSLMYSWSARH